MQISELSFTVSILILVIVVIRSLTLHKLPKATFMTLWLLVLCRLLIPINIASKLSVYTPFNTTEIVVSDPGVSIPSIGILPQIVPPVENFSSAVANSPIVLIWAVGCILLALFFLGTHFRLRPEYDSSLPIEHPFISQWLKAHPIRRQVHIRQSDRISAPLTYGIFSPTILLPKTMDWTDEKQLAFVLTHEWVHIQRFDVLTKWLLAAALCIYWFNPLVWVMYVLANRDIELFCDETVIRTVGATERVPYAQTLIRLEERRSGFAPLSSSFSKHAVTERINAVMKMKEKTLLSIFAAIVLIVVVVVGFIPSSGNYKITHNAVQMPGAGAAPEAPQNLEAEGFQWDWSWSGNKLDGATPPVAPGAPKGR